MILTEKSMLKNWLIDFGALKCIFMMDEINKEN